MSVGGVLWTYLGESWLPMAAVVGLGLYTLVDRTLHGQLRAREADERPLTGNDASEHALTDVDEDAHHALKLFVTDYVIPMGCAQRDLQIEIIRDSCANSTALDLATHGILSNWQVRGFGDNFDYLWGAFCSSPEDPVEFDDLKSRVLSMDKNYNTMLEQTERLARDATIDYRTAANTKALWEQYCIRHNELVTEYRRIKRDRRFGKLCRPGINGPWTEEIPGIM